MESQTSSGILEHGAEADLYRNTLIEIPTSFGRLVYLSALRTHTGRYEHHGMSQIYGKGETNRVLRECHAQTFADWLCFGLEQQKADLDLYLSAFGADRRRVIETWIRLAPYRNLVPTSVRKVELLVVLDRSRNAAGVAQERIRRFLF
jgi:hypothetical protein